MGTRNIAITYKDGDDDFDFLMFRVVSVEGGGVALEGMLRQSPNGPGDAVESKDTLAALPVAALGGISKAQFRNALKGWMLHLRAKAGIV